jgi:cytochrome o ubiquinol oxidase subunit 3
MSDMGLPASVGAIRRVREDPHRLGYRTHGSGEDVEGTGHGTSGPAHKRIIVGYGFWIFLLSDIVMFSCFFAAFAVQRGAVAGGPSIGQIVDIRRVGFETAALLLSSYPACCPSPPRTKGICSGRKSSCSSRVFWA